jgi:hypothetical protein
MMVDLRKAWSVRLRAFSRIVHLRPSLLRPAEMSGSTTNDHAAQHTNQEDEVLDGETSLHASIAYF